MTGKCPGCERTVVPVSGGEPAEHSGVANVGVCPECDTVLGVSEWLD